MTHAVAAVRRFLRLRVQVPVWARPWLHVAKRVACIGLVAVAGVTLGIKVHHDAQTTASVLRPYDVRHSQAQDAQWECIRRAIRAAVPEGSLVDVSFPQNLVYFQRMAELTTGWAVPQHTVGGAQWRLIIYRSHHGFCSGLAVAVQRP